MCLKINATGNPGCTLFNSECTINAKNTLRTGPALPFKLGRVEGRGVPGSLTPPRIPCRYATGNNATLSAAGRPCQHHRRRVRELVDLVGGLPDELPGRTCWSAPWTFPRTTLLNDAQTYRAPTADQSSDRTLAKCKLPASTSRSHQRRFGMSVSCAFLNNMRTV